MKRKTHLISSADSTLGALRLSLDLALTYFAVLRADEGSLTEPQR
jgi:hypothetical protein